MWGVFRRGPQRSSAGPKAQKPLDFQFRSGDSECAMDESQARMPPAGGIGIGLVITSLGFFLFAAIEAVHGDALAATTNCEIALFLLIAGELLLWRSRSLGERAVRLASSGTSTVGVVTGMAKTWYQ